MIKAVIFDAYGTLIDTGDGSIQAAGNILRKNRQEIDVGEFYRKWKEHHREHIDSLSSFIKEEDIFLMDLKRLYKEYGIDGNAEEDIKIMLATLGIRNVYPDTVEVLNRLSGKFKVYIGSTSDEATLVSDIKRNDLVIDGLYTSESLRVYKPQLEFYTKILSDIGMEPDEVIFAGDSPVDDVFGPKRAGMKAVWINRKNQELDMEMYSPDYSVTDLYQLVDILEAAI